MFKKLSMIGAALAMTAGGIAAPAQAQYYGDGYYQDVRDDRGRGWRGDDWREREWRGRGWRGDDRRWYRDRGAYRGRDWRYGCQRRDGTTGTILGAVVGGLLGREVVGRRGDRTAGTIVGGAAGALAGRAIDRGGDRCR